MGLRKTVYLSLGSNLGDRRAHLARAQQALEAAGIRILRQASLYATEPVGRAAQHWFLNTVVEAETELMPRQLLRAVQDVERRLGRRRLVRNGPRVVDIDILFYGNSVVRAAELQIPHPRLAERRFVLAPLRELAPTLRHPILGRTIAELLATAPDYAQVRRWRG
ncbi:MAG: 2-amino-4-hydroxy-6-hydroxymethyldihydropteridine diphosphokinase [Acidobacteriia bacterium]|jgi:2-amino-4-hydroxy-6-hydroxymethyldihydropteridine diphosphokinase|nr:2-amino-4-hydroxy-6-hydroxymethyldihydropteridine diphosphokinase [Terriglobia bacterium]